MLITCPSGMSFQARKWRIGDRRNLHDQQINKQGLLMRKMLECVDMGLENPGPYAFKPGKPVPWAQVALIDIVDALVAIRLQTRPTLDYTDSCGNCGAPIPVSVDLSELERTEMSEEGRTYLASGLPIEKVLEHEAADGSGDVVSTTVAIKMLLGKDMPVLAQHYKQDPTSMQDVQMVLHIDHIVTPAGDKLDTFHKIHKYYCEQDWTFQEALDEAIEVLGGGVTTLVDTTCMRCNAEQQGILPFGAEFYYPKKKRSSSTMAML